MERMVSRWATLGAVMVLAAACTDEKIVYRDGPNIVAPPAAAANYVGYSDQATKRTVCGSCHAEIGAKWTNSKHAGAWKTLADNSSKQAFCEGCHTVNGLGNNGPATAGWTGVADSRYQDVQCESCHGAGLTHASSPTTANATSVLASIAADTGTGARARGSCAACHNGSHHPFDKEWRASHHGSVPFQNSPGGRAECVSCHEGQSALKNIFGVKSNFKERTNEAIPTQRLALTCVVCHDPHGESGNPAQLRVGLGTGEENLCAKCHTRRANPDAIPGGRTSPHAPEAPTVFGTAGWWPPGVRQDTLVGSHGVLASNPNTCATCHVVKYSTTDPVSKQTIASTGHMFLAVPCVDANGIPTTNQNCTGFTGRSYRGCLGARCHATEAVARSAITSADANRDQLVTIMDSLNARAQRARPADFVSSGPWTVGKGSQFNTNLARFEGAITHNPFLIRTLLAASSDAVRATYGVSVTAQEEAVLLENKSYIAAQNQLRNR